MTPSRTQHSSPLPSSIITMATTTTTNITTATSATTAATTTEDEDSYIDYEAFLTPTFSPHSFANTLITSTNDLSDPSLDLTTPLSRVLFDLQEIDTHIHSLTTASALPLLDFTEKSNFASAAVLGAVETQVKALRSAYDRLQKDVAQRSRTAEEVLMVVERLHTVTAQLREIGRALVIARQIEVQISELTKDRDDGDFKALVRASQNIRELRVGKVLADVDEGVILVRDLKKHVFTPAETFVLAKAREAVLGFEPNPTTQITANGTGNGSAAFGANVGGRSVEVMKEKAGAGALALFLLSQDEGGLLTTAMQTLLNTAVNASLGALTRSLTALTTLDRSVAEVAARCQNLVALQTLLTSIPLPSDEDAAAAPEYTETTAGRRSLLDPLLEQLDTTNLQSMFFRSVATGLEPRVSQVVARGGSNARILRGAKERVRNSLRACVERGLGPVVQKSVDFEVAVMVGAAGSLGR
ncbi:Golgi transport complex subunit 5-domain-containing protein [Trichophaea hybrida]|nr:Golgi transport complex subunit 5-domain-containing protein [Trichophaea hybrida]